MRFLASSPADTWAKKIATLVDAHAWVRVCNHHHRCRIGDATAGGGPFVDLNLYRWRKRPHPPFFTWRARFRRLRDPFPGRPADYAGELNHTLNLDNIHGARLSALFAFRDTYVPSVRPILGRTIPGYYPIIFDFFSPLL